MLSAGTISQPVIGTPVTISGTDYTGDGVTLTYQWFLNGTEIADADEDAYTPQAGDDLGFLRVRVTATNVDGASYLLTPGLTVRYAAPAAIGSIDPKVYDEGDGGGDETFSVAADFSGDNLAFRIVSGQDFASVDGSGTVTILTDAVRAATNIVVEASNSGGAATHTISVQVRALPPEATGSLDPQTFAKGATNRYIDASGLFSGTSLAFSIDVDASVATIDPVTGIIAVNVDAGYAPTDITVTATNSGGSDTVVISVEVTVAAPFAIPGAIPDSYAFLQGSGPRTIPTAAAFSGGVDTYSIDPDPAWLSINSATGVITVLTDDPQAEGVFTVTGANFGGEDEIDIDLEVLIAAPALTGSTIAPVVATVGEGGGSVTRDASVLFTGSSRQYRISPASPIASVNASTGLVTISTAAQANNQNITVEAYNDGGAISYTFAARINDIQPVITNPLTSLAYTEGDATENINLATRVSGLNLTWTLVAGGPHAQLTALGMLIVAPDAVVSDFPIVVDVANTGGTARFQIALTVSARAPLQVSAIPAIVFTKGGIGTYNLAQHFSGTGLTYTRQGLPTYFSVDYNTGLLTASTAAKQASGTFTLVVSNGVSPDITLTPSIEVRLAAPQAIASIPNQSFDHQTGPQVVETAFAFSGEELVYSLDVGGDTLTIDPATGQIPVSTETVFTNKPVTVRASNGVSPAATRSFYISVNEVVSGEIRVPLGYPIAARTGPATGQIYVCFSGPTFWGDGNAAGDGLGTAGNLFMDLGGYRYVLSGAYGGVGVGAIGETFAVGPAPDTIPIDEVRGLPIGEGVIGESFVIGPLPDDFWAPGMDSAACLLLDAPPDLHGQTVSINVWAVNSHGRTGATATTSVAISATTSDDPPEIDGDYLTSGSGDLLTANETELLYTAG